LTKYFTLRNRAEVKT